MTSQNNDYKRDDQIIEQLISKAGYESPISKAKIRASQDISNNNSNNVRNSLASKYTLKDLSTPLQSTTAIAALLAGTSTTTALPTSANVNTVTITTVTAGGGSTTPASYSYNTNQITSNNNYNFTTVQNINKDKEIDLLSKYGFNNNGVNNNNVQYEQDYQVDEKRKKSSNNNKKDEENNITNGLTSYTKYINTDEGGGIYNSSSKYNQQSTQQQQSDKFDAIIGKYNNELRSSGINRRLDEQYGLIESKQLIKDYPQTRGSAIVDKIESFNPKNNDVYGSLSVMHNQQLKYGGSISGPNSIRDTQILTNTLSTNLANNNNNNNYGSYNYNINSNNNVEESINLNQPKISYQTSQTISNNNNNILESEQQKKITNVLSKFASQQQTPIGIKQSGLKGSISTTNLYKPIESVEETIKRATNTLNNTKKITSPQKNITNNNEFTFKSNYNQQPNSNVDIYESSTTPIYEPIIINSQPIVNYQNNGLSSINSQIIKQNEYIPTSQQYKSLVPSYSTSNIYDIKSTENKINSYPKYESSNINTNSNLSSYTPMIVNSNQKQTNIISINKQQTIQSDAFSTKWESIIQRGESHGILFSDPEFLPSSLAIGGSYPHKVSWIRASEIFKNGYEIFVKGIDATTLIQGDLGNNYFRAAISALAEKDFSILKLFQTKSVNKAGCYVLNICWKGVWIHVILDDKFPTKNINEICFTHSSSNELWVMLLEKAWAKLHGSYAKIDGGLVREIMHDLTGAPTRTFFLSKGEGQISKDELWERLQHGEGQNLVMITQRSEEIINDKELERIQDLYEINNKHSYTVLGAIQLKSNSSNTNYQFVKLRNPNCKNEWQIGSEDKYLNKLPIEVVERLNYGGRSQREGYFLMDLSDFYRYYTDLQICYLYDGFQYTGEKLCAMRGQKNYYKIEINQPGFYFFQISQQSIRTERISEQLSIRENDYYSKVYFILSSENNPQESIIQLTGSQRDLTSYSYLDNPIYLQNGLYYAFVQVDWKYSKMSSGNCGFGCFGSSFIDIRSSTHQSCNVFASHVESQFNQNSSWENI